MEIVDGYERRFPDAAMHDPRISSRPAHVAARLAHASALPLERYRAFCSAQLLSAYAGSMDVWAGPANARRSGGGCEYANSKTQITAGTAAIANAFVRQASQGTASAIQNAITVTSGLSCHTHGIESSARAPASKTRACFL